VLLVLASIAACGDSGASVEEHAAPVARSSWAQGSKRARSATASGHLQITGTHFVTATGQPFPWRGITAFRLLDYVARKKEADVRAYLAWAQSQDLTVVRVLAMGSGFMQLSPDEGRAALGRLLDLAQEYGVHVEIVALANTRELPVSLDEQIAAIGTIAAAHANALVELANEPIHPTQAPDVGKADVLAALAARIPDDVPVAWGSIETDERFSGGDYVTWHVPRETRPDGWGHVLAVAHGATFLQKFGKPVVNDEPIGAGPRDEPGRRDNRPARFRAAALLTRLTGMGATFHYEGGLQATIPQGAELACLAAWREAWTLLPADVESQGTFAAAGNAGAVVQDFDRQAAYGLFERATATRGWILAIGAGEPKVQLAPGWMVEATKEFEGLRLISVVRSAPAPSRTSP